jgi:hypothetical protein
MNAIWEWCHHSATIVWARIKMAGGAVIAATGTAVEILHMDGVQDSIRQVMNPAYLPYFGLFVVLLGAITEACRRRTLEIK